ncbi:hypothetical protein ACI65C_005914 [Semiaphis heraclei]
MPSQEVLTAENTVGIKSPSGQGLILGLLRGETVRTNYENEVGKKLKEYNVQIDVDLDWEKDSNAVKKAATTSIG